MKGNPEIPPEEFRELLDAGSNGHEIANGQIWEVLYQHLYSIARNQMRKEHEGHTFSTTDLVHEAYLKLVHSETLSVDSRLHFLGIAARVMRHVLIDHARKNRRNKRRGKQFATSLENREIPANNYSDELIELNDALNRLNEIDERLSQIVEYRFFGGMTIDQTASLLNISSMTVKRDWSKAKAWLYKELRGI